MKKFWSKRIQNAVPYTPGEQPQGRVFIKLNTNELPYPPSPAALSAMRGAADDALRLYPDPECTALRGAIADAYGLSAEQVFCGNGSDELLAFAFQAFFDPAPGVVFPDVTYSFYPVYADFFGLNTTLVPVNADLSIPVRALASAPGGVVLANPNAPTGLALPLSDLRAILDAHPQDVVVVDEAYVDFGAESAVGLIEDYANLLVIQTLSKSRGLAGLRVGYAMGHPHLIAALRCVRDSINSYTVDRVAQAGAAAAMADAVYFSDCVNKIMSTRERVADRLRALGFAVTDSKTNFLFVKHPHVPGELLASDLRARGLLVRRWTLPRIENHLRISVGTDAEMDVLCAALEELVCK